MPLDFSRAFLRFDGKWIVAADMGIPLDSEDCYGYVEDWMRAFNECVSFRFISFHLSCFQDNAVTPDQISRTWKVRIKGELEWNDDLRHVRKQPDLHDLSHCFDVVNSYLSKC